MLARAGLPGGGGRVRGGGGGRSCGAGELRLKDWSIRI